MRHLVVNWLVLTLLLAYSSLSAQNNNKEERLVRLIRAETAQSYENNNLNIKLVTGNAQFLHNGALIICDSAIWNAVENTVDAKGNVRIIHENNTLTSDQIHYIADSSLAQVRGHIVELMDKDSNRLRTHFLDYNTKDSIAYFFHGGSMMDTTGNTIESLYGYYHSQIKRFKFMEQVEMSAQGMILKSDSLVYWAQEERSEFLGKTYGWQDDGFLSSNKGWYVGKDNSYGFYDNAYLSNKENEIWADSLVYNKNKSEARLWRDIQILDTAQSLIMFSDYAQYRQDPLHAKMYDNPSVAMYSMENDIPDTLFFAADTISYKALAMNLVDSAVAAESIKRQKQGNRDYIKEMFTVQNIAPDTSIIDTAKIPAPPSQIDSAKVIDAEKLVDSLRLADNLRLVDSLRLVDTLAIPGSLPKQDSIAIPPATNANSVPVDTTLVRFVFANKNIRFFRSDLQGRSDSLLFNSIDSIIRMYKDPVIWSEENQFTSDSIFLFTSGNSLKKADLLTNAFVASKEDSLHYNQVKATDMTAWFSKGDLSRFDAFGGVSLVFFLEEDSIITTMNKKECKAMSATIIEKSVQQVRYYENVKSDAYPIFELEPEDKTIKGFTNREEERPKERRIVSDRKLYPSKREEYGKLSLPLFPYTNKFFETTPEKQKAGQ